MGKAGKPNAYVTAMVVLMIFFQGLTVVSAYTGDAAGTETQGETPIPDGQAIQEDLLIPGNPVQPEGSTPFSIPGNGELVDVKVDDRSKEFLTIRTKNGNTFFLVLDRSGAAENVYLLSMVDESDLAEFIEESEKSREEARMPRVLFPEFSPTPVPALPEREEKAEAGPAGKPEAGSLDSALIPAACLAFAGGLGLLYYQKAVRPRKAKEERMEDLEFYDGGSYQKEEEKH